MEARRSSILPMALWYDVPASADFLDVVPRKKPRASTTQRPTAQENPRAARLIRTRFQRYALRTRALFMSTALLLLTAIPAAAGGCHRSRVTVGVPRLPLFRSSARQRHLHDDHRRSGAACSSPVAATSACSSMTTATAKRIAPSISSTASRTARWACSPKAIRSTSSPTAGSSATAATTARTNLKVRRNSSTP